MALDKLNCYLFADDTKMLYSHYKKKKKYWSKSKKKVKNTLHIWVALWNISFMQKSHRVPTVKIQLNFSIFIKLKPFCSALDTNKDWKLPYHFLFALWANCMKTSEKNNFI